MESSGKDNLGLTRGFVAFGDIMGDTGMESISTFFLVLFLFLTRGLVSLGDNIGDAITGSADQLFFRGRVGLGDVGKELDTIPLRMPSEERVMV
ncbi:MAG: hypothetical protein SGARI_004192, partial [Bacillariaceae sp.]